MLYPTGILYSFFFFFFKLIFPSIKHQTWVSADQQHCRPFLKLWLHKNRDTRSDQSLATQPPSLTEANRETQLAWAPQVSIFLGSCDPCTYLVIFPAWGLGYLNGHRAFPASFPLCEGMVSAQVKARHPPSNCWDSWIMSILCHGIRRYIPAYLATRALI